MAMTVKDLKEALEGYDDDMEIFVSHIASDHWKTELASPLESYDDNMIEFSDYHRQYKVVDSSEDIDESDSGYSSVLLLKINNRF